MKLSIVCTASLLFGASLALVTGQERPDAPPPPPPGERAPGGPEGGKRPPATEIAKNLSTRYEAIAAFDTDKNGKLDATEQAAVAKAIDAGTLEVGPPRPPQDKGKGKGEGKDNDKPVGNHPPSDKAAEHVAKLYESVAAYDTDKNAKLDATEQAAVAKAIEDGTLKLPRPGGPGGPGGRRGGRPGGGPAKE
jgi:hypothetical protein